MAIKIIIGLLVVALAANGVLGYFAFMQKGDINSLVEELATAQQEATASATAQAEQLETTRQETTSLIGDNTDLIAGLAEDIASNLASINTEAGHINALGSNLSALSGRVDDIIPGLVVNTIYQQVNQTVVGISDGGNIVGAGFIYDDDGHVVTDYHVIEDLDNIYVILADGTISKASIVGSSPRSDVSVLILERSTSLTPATISDSSTVAIGDHALVVGHPFEEDNSLTVGVVSQLNRCERISYGRYRRLIASLIQFDAPSNFGNSGGPVFNADGEVIGMVTGGVNPLVGEGISYAISSNKIQRVADDIIRNGSFSCLFVGVYVTDVTPAEAETAGCETIHGAMVTGLPYFRLDIGIQVRDIIVAIDDFAIDDAGSLASYLGEHQRNVSSLDVRVIRGGTELTIEVTRVYYNDRGLIELIELIKRGLVPENEYSKNEHF